MANNLLIVTALMHGNEKAGWLAVERIQHRLANKQHHLNGGFLAIKCNEAANVQNTRFIHEDLNRIWTDQRIDQVSNTNSGLSSEEHALKKVHAMIEHELQKGYDRVVLADLHTTSAKGGIFVISPRTADETSLEQKLHVPLMLGFEHELEGTAMHYYEQRGIHSFAFEGGQHDAPASVDRLEAGIWILLNELNILSEPVPNDVPRAYQLLDRESKSLPHLCRLRYHHQIGTDDDFNMLPGFKNFDQISKGQPLAMDKNGTISAPMNGHILMPLYQKKGNDGFFIIAEV